MAVPSSLYDKAPHRAIIPPVNHRAIIHMGECKPDRSKPEVVKMPAPTMLATTMLVTGKRPSDLFRA